MLKYNEYITEAKKAVKHPFIQAAARGNNNKVKEYLKDLKNLDINMQDKEGKTALMYAVAESYLLVVNTLVDAGADVNLQDTHGSTALMMAPTNKIINKLLDADADVNIQDEDGKNALMLKLGYHESMVLTIIDKFLEKGLDLSIKDSDGNTFYDMIKLYSEKRVNKDITNLLKIENFLNEKFPELKEEWELKQAVGKYNM